MQNTEIKTPYITNHKLLNSHKEFINDLLSNTHHQLAIHLTFKSNYQVSIDQAKKDIIFFKNLLDKSIFGRSNNKLKDHIPGCIVVEGDDYHSSTKTHIHGLLGFNISPTLSKFHIQQCWHKLKRAGFVKQIAAWDGDPKYIEYILKSNTKNELFSDSVLSWRSKHQSNSRLQEEPT